MSGTRRSPWWDWPDWPVLRSTREQAADEHESSAVPGTLADVAPVCRLGGGCPHDALAIEVRAALARLDPRSRRRLAGVTATRTAARRRALATQRRAEGERRAREELARAEAALARMEAQP